MYQSTVVMVNINGALQPSVDSPATLWATMYGFAELHSFRWNTWLTNLPTIMQSVARAAITMIYIPAIIALYQSRSMSELIFKFKTGAITETGFFHNILDEHFAFLKILPLTTAPIELLKQAWLKRIHPPATKEVKRFETLLTNFNDIILMSNTNPSDMIAWLEQLQKIPALKQPLPDVAKVLTMLKEAKESHQGGFEGCDYIISRCLSLGPHVKLAISSELGEFKLQDVDHFMKTGSFGFLSAVLEQLRLRGSHILVISDAKLDRHVAKKKYGVRVSTIEDYFKDEPSLLQRFQAILTGNNLITLIAIVVIMLGMMYSVILKYQ